MGPPCGGCAAWGERAPSTRSRRIYRQTGALFRRRECGVQAFCAAKPCPGGIHFRLGSAMGPHGADAPPAQGQAVIPGAKNEPIRQPVAGEAEADFGKINKLVARRKPAAQKGCDRSAAADSGKAWAAAPEGPRLLRGRDMCHSGGEELENPSRRGWQGGFPMVQ